MQIGVRQVIAGWDEGILGDGQELPPMKVTPLWQHRICTDSVACCAKRHLLSAASSMDLDLTKIVLSVTASLLHPVCPAVAYRQSSSEGLSSTPVNDSSVSLEYGLRLMDITVSVMLGL